MRVIFYQLLAKNAEKRYRVKFDSLDLRHAETAEPQILGLASNPAILQLWYRDRFALRKTVEIEKKKMHRKLESLM